jgi:hypothetical protein
MDSEVDYRPAVIGSAYRRLNQLTRQMSQRHDKGLSQDPAMVAEVADLKRELDVLRGRAVAS